MVVLPAIVDHLRSWRSPGEVLLPAPLEGIFIDFLDGDITLTPARVHVIHALRLPGARGATLTRLYLAAYLVGDPKMLNVGYSFHNLI